MIQFFYATPLIPLLPAVIAGAGSGDFTVIQRVWPLLAFDRTQAEGMYFSTVCAEDADFVSGDVNLSGLPPQLSSLEIDNTEAMLDACRGWDVPALASEVDAAVTSDVPVLIFNGQFDPITPPAFGETAAESLSRSYLYTFPGLGHGALPDSSLRRADRPGVPGRPGLQARGELPDRPTVRDIRRAVQHVDDRRGRAAAGSGRGRGAPALPSPDSSGWVSSSPPSSCGL